MIQQFKSVYFSDHPGITSQQKNLKIAFGKSEQSVYDAVRPLSSQEVRELLGFTSYLDLQQAAGEHQQSINAHCVEQLRNGVLPNPRENSIGNRRPKNTKRRRKLLIEPIKATFRGGRSQLLHEWYPYLEGYSPEFVKRILEEFAPGAEHVIDPFGGLGTTPLTAVRMGVNGSYCELNPLLQLITEAKSLALSLPVGERNKTIASLAEIRLNLVDRLRETTQDCELAHAYDQVFGTSEFFDPDVYDLVLRSRAFLDELDCVAPIVAKFVTVALVASLIPASRLIRRGDLRFRNETERRSCNDSFLEGVLRQLQLISRDLAWLSRTEIAPFLVCSDARQLDKVPFLDADVVVTSPPYLNGTNYYRNTKVELWFLRNLFHSSQLADFRRHTVTAGINDVTLGKQSAPVTRSIEKLVQKLEGSAYDQRIPQMVQMYFYDMERVFAGLRTHLRDNAFVALDIGNSAYGGVLVDTPKLLIEILSDLGFVHERDINLRKRMSRGGKSLKQVLMTFRCNKVRGTTKRITAEIWQPAWRQFRATLPHQSGTYSKRNWGHPLHSLCSFQGKMKPSLAHHLVRTFLPEGGRLLDPFGGVGTIAFEAALQGIKAWSFDISPAAVPISAAKLERPCPSAARDVFRRLTTFVESEKVSDFEFTEANQIAFNGALPEYFHPETLREILLARRYFRLNPPFTADQSLVLACLLHILHGNRPYALSRRSHPITPFSPTGPTEYRGLASRLQDKLERSLSADFPESFACGKALHQDATHFWPLEIDELDAVITSPPFYDSTRFYLANWMRLWFSGWESREFRRKPFSFVDERQKKDFRVYEPVLRQARERLKPGGVVVFHLGKSKKCDMANEISQIAAKWFRVRDVLTECVAHCESHGIRDKGTVVAHTYLVLN